MSDEENKNAKISIGEIYDQLSAKVPPSVPKKEVKKTEEFKEIRDTVNESRIKSSCIKVSGDVEYLQKLIFKLYPVTAGLKAFKNDSKIYTDVPLLKAAISAAVLSENEKQFNADTYLIKNKYMLLEPDVICVEDHPKALEFAKKYNVSKAVAGFMVLKDDIKNSIIIIGKDDAALLSVCRLIERGIRPYLVLGFPAGPETQKGSKKYLAEADLRIPLITMPGTKGGIEVAAACFVELMKINEENKD
ncbi:MAG: precorrin-8X methylmutase [Methanimicrococcus sp.]|nr:precorrin-8X methylmutase [Methanimicrococcus sp.]